jgi:hypothetical protein
VFLLSDRRQGIHRALQRLRSEIAAHVECGPIHLEDIAGRTLGWFACSTTQEPDLIVRDPTVPDRFKRALITLSHVLTYLGRPNGTAP